jgi:hypothetical protein
VLRARARRTLIVAGLLAAVFAAALAAQASAGGLKRAEAVQERNTDRLLGRKDIVGTAVSKDKAGRAEIVIFTTAAGANVPRSLDGIQVDAEVTGPISATQASPKAGGGRIDPTAVWPRPVPIGVSTGNAGECSAGTIGARVRDSSGNVFALSNNHVYALENSAPIGSEVLQPGLYDTNCAYSSSNVLGHLTRFVSINFSDTANNVVDGAVASTTTASLGNSTPANGYGTPSSTTRAASIGLAVQKYGRTSSLTTGQVTDINATIQIRYSSGTARFVDQVVVQSKKPVIKSGDSGSLLVSNDAGHNPVGLLFAGDSSGKYAIANPIGSVLSALGVTIDGS